MFLRRATTQWRAGARSLSSSGGGGPGKAWTLPEVAEQWEAFNENEAIDENLGLWGQIKLFSSLMSYDVHPHFEPSEFVEGAQAAYVSMHTMMHSQAFVNAVAGHSDDAEDAAGQMRSMLSPRCYRIISETMAAADQMGQRWTVERCDVSAAGLSALRVHRFGNPWQRRLTFATLGFTDESVEDVQRLMFEITADPGRKDELLVVEPEVWAEADLLVETDECMQLDSKEHGDVESERQVTCVVTFVGCIDGQDELNWTVSNLA
jgi:hypothetical protein